MWIHQLLKLIILTSLQLSTSFSVNQVGSNLKKVNLCVGVYFSYIFQIFLQACPSFATQLQGKVSPLHHPFLVHSPKFQGPHSLHQWVPQAHLWSFRQLFQLTCLIQACFQLKLLCPQLNCPSKFVPFCVQFWNLELLICTYWLIQCTSFVVLASL